MKFYGEIGFGESVEGNPGVYEDVITERLYYGDVVRNSRKLESGEKVNNDLSVGNSISIVADAYLNEHFFKMRYIKWMGCLWLAETVTVEAPRLLIKLGGVYNGPRPSVDAP